jgi:transcriptional regulator with XRE-family HTH domain
MLDWSRDDLSKRSGVGISALMRFEASEGVPAGKIQTLQMVQKALEESGIEFIGSPESGAGVRWRVK